jgi:hypothetical protein
MNAFVTATPRNPINANDNVVSVVAKAPIARGVGLPNCDLIVIGTGT